jgi:hypothetical protein
MTYVCCNGMGKTVCVVPPFCLHAVVVGNSRESQRLYAVSLTAVSHQNMGRGRTSPWVFLVWPSTALLCVHLQRHLLAWWSAERRRCSCWCTHIRQMHPPSSEAQNCYTCDSPYAGTLLVALPLRNWGKILCGFPRSCKVMDIYFFFCNPILFAMCTSTFSKLCKQRIKWKFKIIVSGDMKFSVDSAVLPGTLFPKQIGTSGYHCPFLFWRLWSQVIGPESSDWECLLCSWVPPSMEYICNMWHDQFAPDTKPVNDLTCACMRLREGFLFLQYIEKCNHSRLLCWICHWHNRHWQI